jgi:hypothetical protein
MAGETSGRPPLGLIALLPLLGTANLVDVAHQRGIPLRGLVAKLVGHRGYQAGPVACPPAASWPFPPSTCGAGVAACEKA